MTRLGFRVLSRVAVPLLLLSLWPVRAVAQDEWVPERGARVWSEDGGTHLAGGRGWLRLGAVVSDFFLEFEFRVPSGDRCPRS